MLFAFLHGYILTFSLILPLGPQNMFMVNEGATTKRLLPLALTASVLALCDSAVILVSVFGASEAIAALPQLEFVLMSLGIVFLVYMAYSNFRMFFQASKHELQPARPISFTKKIIYALSVSLLNPHAFLDCVAVIGSAAAAYHGAAKTAFVGAAILNSWVWFFFLAFLGAFIRRYPRVRNGLNLISGVTMLVCAAMLAQMLIAGW